MISRYPGTCRACKRTFAKGDVIYWAPERKPLCEPCRQGEDPVEASLNDADKAHLMKLLDTIASVEGSSGARSSEMQDLFEMTLATLYSQFRSVRRVRTYLERHMDELRSIPARQGMQHSRPLISKRPDVCRICSGKTEKGDLIWWSPSEPLMCFDCGRGKDPVEAALSASDRDRLNELLDRVQVLELQRERWKADERVEYDNLLVHLYSKFRRVVRVKRILVKHIDSLKDIAHRKGTGNKRAVLAKETASCKACNRLIDKGEVVWWSPDQPRLCFDCGQIEQEETLPTDAELQRARQLLSRLAELDEQDIANLPAAWAAKLLDEREDLLIELYCDFRHLDEVRANLYEHFTELCAIAGKAQ